MFVNSEIIRHARPSAYGERPRDIHDYLNMHRKSEYKDEENLRTSDSVKNEADDLVIRVC